VFRVVDPKVNFPKLEEEVLAFWKAGRIFEKSVEQRPEDRLFTFYEGPPTANGKPGIHHLLSRVFKDLIPRYKTMQGYRVPRRGGWDTHGLPVEIEIEKELGLKSKPEIEAYGIAAFNAKCRESVTRYIEEWTRLSERIAFWADYDQPYFTYSNDYIESCWWIFKSLWDAGLVYQDYRSTPHCPRCGTSLSDHEVAQGYKEDTVDPSVFVKFQVLDESLFERGHPRRIPFNNRLHLVAWTTTPWTLPGNTALAVDPDAKYTIYAHGDDLVVMATELGPGVLGEAAPAMMEIPASFLIGLKYEPLYRPEQLGLEVRRFDEVGRLRPIASAAEADGVRRVIGAAHVSLEDGTGIVHVAPAFGGEDFDDGKRERLLFAQPVDLRGVMASGLPGAGLHVKKADPQVLKDLGDRNLLLRAGTLKHTYPFCWRCDDPLLYYAKPSWYIATSQRKQLLLEGNDTINWYPEHIRKGRFGNWLENNIDWAFSRERFWGTPLPFWKCDSCGDAQCIGSRAELVERAVNRPAAEALTDFHRPYIDDIKLRCGACGGSSTRVPEVADAWFDSGAMPYAQWHYPFENDAQFHAQFPADYICEAIDQTRGWFYTLHAEATMLKAAEAVPESISFKNVISLGHILDESGRKMSKHVGNVVRPWDILDVHGADATRWYMYAASPAGSPRRFSSRLVEEGLRQFLLTLWNTYSFFVSYANIDGYRPGSAPVPAGSVPEIDRWLLSELNELVAKVTKELDEYDPTDAARAIQGFVDDLSNWYVRRNRRRFWRGQEAGDADKQSAYDTLYTALVTLAKLLAPFTPFVAEELWQNLVLSADPGAAESVHLASWPTADASRIDGRLNEETQLVKRICSLGRAARAKAQIKVRQPVVEVAVAGRPSAPAEREVVLRQQALILEELNAKALTVLEGESSVVTFDVKPNLPVLGPRLGKELGAVRAALAALPADDIAALRRGRDVTVAGQVLGPGDVLIQEQPRPGYAAANEAGYTVAISTTLTRELEDEGLARELVRRIQDMRREAGFDLADRITTWYTAPGDLDRVLTAHGDYVRAETLSTTLTPGAAPADAHSEQHDLEGLTVTLAVRRNA
jgi:isoleucyl-tRNA synthetase